MKPALQDSEAVAILRDVQQALIAYRDAEARELRIGKSFSTAREIAARRRLELGEQLVRARPLWPRSGPKAKGWGEFLSKIGLEQQRAWECMKLAGYVEEVSPHSSKGGETSVPTLVEAGARSAPKLTLVPPVSEAEDIDEVVATLPPTPNKVDRDAYCTPIEVTEALPFVDLDPCSNPRSTVRARTTYSLEAGQDGLALPWFGLVYANVPFSNVIAWYEKCAAERKNLDGFGFLVNTDHSTAWWRGLLQIGAKNRLDFHERLEFAAGPGIVTTTNDRPQTLLMDAGFLKRCTPKLFELGVLWKAR